MNPCATETLSPRSTTTPPPSISDPFALLVPLTHEAHVMMAGRKHRHRLVKSAAYAGLQLPKVPKKRRQYIAGLNFATIRGLRSFTFGSSRFNIFQFPAESESGVSSYHFTITPNEACSHLVLQAISQAEVWISEPGCDYEKVLGGASVVLQDGCRLRLGREGRFELLIKIFDLPKFYKCSIENTKILSRTSVRCWPTRTSSADAALLTTDADR